MPCTMFYSNSKQLRVFAFPTLSILGICMLVSFKAFGIEALAPEVLCERFLPQHEREGCLRRMAKLKPDTYLSTACRKLFDDDAFFKCVELASQHAPDPRLIAECDQDGLSDPERMTCLRKVARAKPLEHKNRLPAGRPAKSEPAKN